MENVLKPFGKVLGRADHNRWRCDFFCYYDNNEDTDYPFVCVADTYTQCVPYEGNEHLLGTTDDYVEPWTPNDGDFIVLSKDEDKWICIFDCIKKGKIIYKFGLDCKMRVLDEEDPYYSYYPSDGDKVRPATEEEEQLLLSKLHEIGKDWDAEMKEIVEYKWKPNEDEKYWYISHLVTPRDSNWCNIETDNKRYAAGNCFRTEAEAQAMADKFKEMLKGGKE